MASAVGKNTMKSYIFEQLQIHILESKHKNRLHELTKSHLSTTFTIEINRKLNDSESSVLYTRWETGNTNPFEELFDEFADDDEDD